MIPIKKIAFLGSGVMGTALATAAAQGISPDQIVVTDIIPEKAQSLARQLGCSSASNAEAVHQCQYIVFCIKPQFLESVLEEVAPVFQECAARGDEKIIVSIVAGIESQSYLISLGLTEHPLPVIRMLPNTACLIGKGFTLMMADGNYQPQQAEELQHILRFSGGFTSLPASRFVAGTVLTSTSPAFIAMFASALADGGVYNGLLRPEARALALQGLLSTIQLMLSSEKHPEQLKDEVCSPAGPAMYGVKSLEDSGFRSSVTNAVITAYQRFSDMSNLK